jgi:hypothetical protein
MEENTKDNPNTEDGIKKQNCGCDCDCNKPKKRNIFSILLFAVILLAALGIIGMKLINKPDPKDNKQMLSTPGKPSCCDTTMAKGCDTKKDSSCCSKGK